MSFFTVSVRRTGRVRELVRAEAHVIWWAAGERRERVLGSVDLEMSEAAAREVLAAALEALAVDVRKGVS